MNARTHYILITLALLSPFSLLPPSSAHAQGTAFTYQGRLNDGTNPATGSYDPASALFSVSRGAEQVGGTLTISTTGVTNGVPNVQVAPQKRPEAIPWDQIGARAGADYQDDGLSVAGTEVGARLHCVFQRLDGEATREGLWLVSTVTNRPSDRFRVMATAMGGRALAGRGTVTVSGQGARFTRAGLVEEYSVSMDGVRQDFVVTEKPAGAGPLAVELAVNGARVEQASFGAQLVLEKSGRKIAYSRLRATDANGKELPARLEVQRPLAFSLQPSAFSLSVVVDDTGAVYPVRIDPTFSDANWIAMGGVSGTDGTVYAAVTDGSGNLYIGGDFGVVGNNVAKWNGNAWFALGSGMNNYVYALAVSGTNLYAGGLFTNAGGTAATNIAQWNGSSWSALGAGINIAPSQSGVRALAVSGETLYAGGGFTNAGGTAATNIAQWNGSSWSALGSGLNNIVYALTVSGGTLYAGGVFTTAGGIAATNIAQWNGSSWSALGSGLNRGVRALAVSGTNLYAGGLFTTAGSTAANRIAQWNGSSWSALGSGVNGEVNALAVSGTNLYAGGLFTNAGGTAANRIAQWNGSSWLALGSGLNSNVLALAVSGGTLYAGGIFTGSGIAAANSIAQWDGSGWSALAQESGLNNIVYALAVSGGTLYAGGAFTTAGGTLADYIAQWNGSSWSALGSGLNYHVYALAVSGTNLYAGGGFTMAGGYAASCIAQWNGSSWSALGSGTHDPSGFASPVYALAVSSGGTLYAGGAFTTAGGTAANGIAQWNGSSWSALDSGMNSNVLALAVSGGTLYAGGAFTTAGGSVADYIAQWNGSSWSAVGLDGVGGGLLGTSPTVNALALSGGTLYVGGWFTLAGGHPGYYNIAQWNGSSWLALGSGVDGEVNALAVSGTNLYAGGLFTTAGGSPVNYIAQWNGSSWSALGSGLNYDVYALAVSGTNLYAGGGFTTAGGKVSFCIARAVLGDAQGYNQLAGAPSPGGTMQFSYIGYPDTNYALDRAFDLRAPVNWVGQQTNTMTVSGVLLFTNTPVPGTNNFWRVRSVPQ